MVPLEEYPHAAPDDTLREAARMLVQAQIAVGKERQSMPRVVLVFEDDKLVGAVRRRDILKGLEIDLLEELDRVPDVHIKSEVDPNLAEVLSPDKSEHWRTRFGRPIREVMHNIEGQVEVGDSLTKVIYELVGNDTHMAVVAEEGHAIGVVRTVDVLRHVYHALTILAP